MSRRFAMVMPELPWPVDQGSRRFMHDAAALLRRHAEVDLFTREIGDQAGAIGELERRGFHLELDPSYRDQSMGAKIARRIRNELHSLRSGRPRELHYTATSILGEKLRARAEMIAYEAVIGVFWHTWPIMALAPEGRRVLLISDVEHVRAADEERVQQRQEAGGAFRSLREAELEAWCAADWLLCISEVDAERAREALRGVRDAPEIAVWPVAFAATRPARRKPRDDSERSLLCFGHWEAPFNRDGLLWFVNELWSPVAARFPGWRLRVAGKGIDAELRRILANAPSVEPLGWVDSLEEELLRADLTVIPLRYAGGLRYRLLEAVGAGCPTICSDVAASGSAFASGEHYLAVNHADELAEVMTTLLHSEGRAAMLNMAGRALEQLQTSYGEGRAASELARLLDRIGRKEERD